MMMYSSEVRKSQCPDVWKRRYNDGTPFFWHLAPKSKINMRIISVLIFVTDKATGQPVNIQ